MAKIQTRFLDKNDDAFIQALGFEDVIRLEIWCPYQEEMNVVDLDISTAIKFSKALRIEISKVKEREVNNG